MPLPANLPTLEGVRALPLSGIAALPPDYLSALRQEADGAVKAAKTISERNRAKTTADWLDNVVLLRIPAPVEQPTPEASNDTEAELAVDEVRVAVSADTRAFHVEENITSGAGRSLNLQRGLLRTWVAVSALWIAFVAGLFVAGYLEERFGLVGLRLLGVAALTPPMAVLAVGLLVAWVVKGFSRT